MQAKSVSVKNFRSLVDFAMDLDRTTVVIGENNSGKTSVLDAMRLALSHRWGLRGTGFDEYDFHLSQEQVDPKKSDAIEITVRFSEDEVDEWPDDMIADIRGGAVQPDPLTGIQHINLRAKYSFSIDTELFEPSWVFLNLEGNPIGKESARSTNLSNFFTYVPVFSLSALRDASNEFSSRSQFWGKLVKSINIKDDEWDDISKELDQLNEKLVASEPKFSSIKKQLEEIKKVMPSGSVDAVDLRALPLRIWDLIAKTELLIRANENDPPLPLSRFGHGVQSLAVLNIFHAYVSDLLAEEYEKESEPILLMEEPEAHLHPQATRALFNQLEEMPGQKLVTTHSPYFLQNAPFSRIRLMRKVDGSASAFAIPKEFAVTVPLNSDLEKFVKKYSKKFEYRAESERLVAQSNVEEQEYRELLTCFSSQEDRQKYHPQIKQFRKESAAYISSSDLEKLEDNAKRIRGEIFFSRKWLLVEGQAEYIVLNAVSGLVGYPFDANGISVIDCKNNGSSGLFAALARVFGFPWVVFCDGDGGGDNFIQDISNREYFDELVKKNVFQLPKDQVLEDSLAQSMREEQLTSLLESLSLIEKGEEFTRNEAAEMLKRDKIKIAAACKIREFVSSGKLTTDDIPTIIQDAIEFLKTCEEYD